MAIAESLIESLRASLKNAKVVTPQCEDFAQSLKRWSSTGEKQAGLVVFPNSAEDVSVTLVFAKKNELDIAVCGGGHSSSGSSSSVGGVVIDLSKMRHVSVDPQSMTITAQGGCLWEDVDVAAEKHGLAAVGGTVNHTGIAGLTLGGGYGWLSSKYGLTIDNLLSTQVVLADGQIVKASETENSDLFWALKGAGHSFGVVTEFTYRAHPQRNLVWAGILIFATDKLEQVLKFANSVPDASGDGDNGIVLVIAAPPPLGGDVALLTLVCHNGPASSGEKYFGPLLELGPLVNTVAEIPYSQLNGLNNIAVTHGDRKATKGVTFITPIAPAFMRELIDEFAAFLGKVPEAARSIILLEFIDQRKICEVPHAATAFANRGMYQNGVVVPRWINPENDSICREWARTIAQKFQLEKKRMKSEGHTIAMEGVGEYVNYDGLGSPAKDIFGPNYERLVTLKIKYDPSNVFHKSIALLPVEEGSDKM